MNDHVSAPDRASRGALGLPLFVATLVGVAIAAYLSIVRLAGESPACGPVHGCETVATSEYATLLGFLPVAFVGLVASLVIVTCAAIWWRRGDRRALLLAYGLLLLGTVFVAYLTYLELFVIHAVCAWCAAYAVATVTSLVLTGLALRRHTP
jgi:uncharacterized membrane protein